MFRVYPKCFGLSDAARSVWALLRSDVGVGLCKADEVHVFIRVPVISGLTGCLFNDHSIKDESRPSRLDAGFSHLPSEVHVRCQV